MKKHIQILIIPAIISLFFSCGDSGSENDDTAKYPVYWSKCESTAGITTAETGSATLTDNGTSVYTMSGVATGKFGNGILNNSYDDTSTTKLALNDFNYEELTLSAWIRQWHYQGGTAAMYHTFYFTANTYITIVRHFYDGNNISNQQFFVNGTEVATKPAFNLYSGDFQHITIAYSKTGCKAWQGETLVLDYSGELPAATQCVVEFDSYHYGNNHMLAFLDNLKVWGRYIDDPDYRALEAAGTAESETMLH